MIKLAVIGDPIEHSLSPKIHSYVMEQLGETYTYEAVRVAKGELAPFVERARRGEVDGFNVTMPHKVDIIEFLDEIDRDAEYYNSVNTVKVDGGRLCGYNTDGGGFVRSLEGVGAVVSGAEILFLGSGGVVNTLSQKLALEGARKIVVASRSNAVAVGVCEMLGEKFGRDKTPVNAGRLHEIKDFGNPQGRTVSKIKDFDGSAKNGVATLFAKEGFECEAVGFSDAVIGEKIRTADIVINATPLGMKGFSADWESCEFLRNAKPSALIADLNYNPRVPTLLKAANELGFRTLNGLGMLIYQALLADEIYLGRKFDDEEIVRGLQGLL